ncbi:hypothetical protein DTO280E4_8478 [Paecilomyces variotii]|nr:hypothetical protein DTO280E4_8478 [Paecilomyces variotii]
MAATLSVVRCVTCPPAAGVKNHLQQDPSLTFRLVAKRSSLQSSPTRPTPRPLRGPGVHLFLSSSSTSLHLERSTRGVEASENGLFFSIFSYILIRSVSLGTACSATTTDYLLPPSSLPR